MKTLFLNISEGGYAGGGVGWPAAMACLESLFAAEGQTYSVLAEFESHKKIDTLCTKLYKYGPGQSLSQDTTGFSGLRSLKPT